MATWQGHSDSVTALALSPDGRWALSGSSDKTIIIWQTLTGKILQKYSFNYYVNSIKWSPHNPALIMMGMEDGSVSAWTFFSDTASLQLRWRTHPWGLNAQESQLLGVYGMPESQQQVLIQKGGVVQVSAKSSENRIGADGKLIKGIISQREAWQSYDASNPPKSLFDPIIVIREHAWAISIVRKKVWNKIAEKSDPTRHAFMLLESVEEGYYRIRRIDFVLEQRHQQLPQDPATGVTADMFGQGLIEIADKSLFDMQSLVGQCCARTRGITAEAGRKLLENIHKDQKEKIGYCLMGSSSLYRMFRMKEAQEHHNCISWCEKHLEKIGITDITNQSWIQGVVDNTKWLIPDDRPNEAKKTPNARGGNNINNNNNEVDEPNSGR